MLALIWQQTVHLQWGADAARIYLYPAVNAAWNIRNTLFKNVTFLNDVNLRTEYVMTGNSRFASSIGEYYYLNRVFKGLSGLVRAGIPSVKITLKEQIPGI